ncbi:coiled-coil domain-containing protein 30-like isoform X1 [Magallana gigas]|uniref:coiled-coil domain-containing protein 30-like isoform X1 n=1 Tax=Magallana gigas TaxID=29159 RepID=UPI00333F1E90
MEKKNNQTRIERRNRGRTPGQVQRDLLVSMPSWVAKFAKLPLQRKAPMDQPMQVKLLKNKERRVVEMEELLNYQSETHTKKIKVQMIGVFEELMTFHVQQNIQKNKGRMDEVLQELMTFHDKQKIKIHRRQMRELFAELRTFQEQRKAEKIKEQMRTVLTEIMMFHSQQKIRTSKKLMARVFAELMTFHAQQRTMQIKEKMSEVCAELMTIHAQQETQTQKMMKRMQLVFDELLQTNTERKKLKLLEEEAYEEFVPRKLFLFNIISFKQTDDDHLLQGPSFPDLSSLVASAELELPPESLDGACYVVDDENEGDDEEKMEIPSNNLEKKKNGWRRRIRKFLGLK